MAIRSWPHRGIAATIVVSLGLIGCGGDTTQPPGPPPPPPPPPPPAVAISITPTAVTVGAGLSQEFTATVTNTTNPAVTWTTSGGTLTGTGTTVTWAAPTAAGSFTVTAASVADPSKSASATVTVPGPDPIEVVLNDMVLGAGGGTLTVIKDGSPLNGLTISLPPAAYPVATRWTISALHDVQPTLPAGAEQIGPAIRIENGNASYADLPFTITLPARTAADRVIGAFYYDAETGTFDPLPLLGRTDSTLVLLTRHVSRTQLVPQGALAARRGGFFSRGFASSASTSTSVDVVMLAVPLEELGGPIDTGFRPAQDDWPFTNRGSWLTPEGYSAGASMSALFHFMQRRAQLGRLFTRDDRIPSFNFDNARGIRLASVIHHDLMQATGFRDRIAFVLDSAASVGEDWVVNQARALALNFWLNRLPRMLTVFPFSGAGAAQVIIAFDVNDWKFGVSSTYEPGVGRQITFTGTEWEPFSFPSGDEGPREPFGQVFMMGHSSLMPLAEMERYWAAYENGTIGDGLFPQLIKEYRDPIDSLWRPLRDGVAPQLETVVTASESLFVRTRCPSCGFKRAGPAHPDRILTPVYSMQGQPIAEDGSDAAEGTLLVLPELGAYSTGVLHAWRVTDEQVARTIDWSWLDIERVEFKLTSNPEDPEPGQMVTFELENGGIGDATMEYRWTVGTETPVMTPLSQPSLRREVSASTDRVVVELIDDLGRRRARAELRLSLGSSFHGLGFPYTGSSGGLSEDGSVVVGARGSQPARWTAAGGLQLLDLNRGTARAVSADGSVIVGEVGNVNASRPFRWTAAEGMQLLSAAGFARGISPDGRVIVGENDGIAFRWTAEGGMQSLGSLPLNPNFPGIPTSIAHGVSADGSVIVGISTAPGGREAFRWTAASGMQGLGHLGHSPNSPTSFSSGGLAISDDGSVIVGVSTAPEGVQGVRWVGGSLQGFGASPGNSSEASQVSGDGSIILGNLSNPQGAFIWTAQRGVRELKTALEQEYGLDLTGWTLHRVSAISRNGRVLVGYGANPQGQTEGWRAVLPPNAASAQAAKNGQLRR